MKVCNEFYKHLSGGQCTDEPQPAITLDLSSQANPGGSVGTAREWLKTIRDPADLPEDADNGYHYPTKYQTMRIKWGEAANQHVDVFMGDQIYMTGFISKQYEMCNEDENQYGILLLPKVLITYKDGKMPWCVRKVIKVLTDVQANTLTPHVVAVRDSVAAFNDKKEDLASNEGRPALPG